MSSRQHLQLDSDSRPGSHRLPAWLLTHSAVGAGLARTWGACVSSRMLSQLPLCAHPVRGPRSVVAEQCTRPALCLPFPAQGRGLVEQGAHPSAVRTLSGRDGQTKCRSGSKTHRSSSTRASHTRGLPTAGGEPPRSASQQTTLSSCGRHKTKQRTLSRSVPAVGRQTHTGVPVGQGCTEQPCFVDSG